MKKKVAGFLAGAVVAWVYLRVRKRLGDPCCSKCSDPDCVPIRQCSDTYTCKDCKCALGKII